MKFGGGLMEKNRKMFLHTPLIPKRLISLKEGVRIRKEQSLNRSNCPLEGTIGVLLYSYHNTPQPRNVEPPSKGELLPIKLRSCTNNHHYEDKIFVTKKKKINLAFCPLEEIRRFGTTGVLLSIKPNTPQPPSRGESNLLGDTSYRINYYLVNNFFKG
jgi:hypothetical protein